MRRNRKEPKLVYSVQCLLEDIPLEGNLAASGDDAADRKMEKEVRRELEGGNEWAWCCVKVRCWPADERYAGLSGSACLGGCSFESEQAFLKDACYRSLCDEARQNLRRSAASMVENGELARKCLREVFHCGRLVRLPRD